MKEATAAEIIRDVRLLLNEELGNESLSLLAAGKGGDDTDIDAVAAAHIVPAIDRTHTQSRVESLDGLSAAMDGDYALERDGRVLDILFLVPVLRIVSFRAFDTPFDVREVFAEGSAQGHMQLKPHTMGTWDRPRLIMLADSEDWKPHLRYYSLREGTDADSPVSELIYIPKQFGPSYGADGNSFLISSMLYTSTIEYITGLVLDTYGESERAQAYYTRAAN